MSIILTLVQKRRPSALQVDFHLNHVKTSITIYKKENREYNHILEL